MSSQYFGKAMLAATIISARFGLERKQPWIGMVIEKMMGEETLEINIDDFLGDAPVELDALTPVEVMQCVVWYHHNVDPITQYEAASQRKWTDLDENYQAEKLRDYRQGLVHWWGRFDHRRQQRLVDAAVKKYETDARTRTATIANYEREKVEEDQ